MATTTQGPKTTGEMSRLTALLESQLRKFARRGLVPFQRISMGRGSLLFDPADVEVISCTARV